MKLKDARLSTRAPLAVTCRPTGLLMTTGSYASCAAVSGRPNGSGCHSSHSSSISCGVEAAGLGSGAQLW